LSGELDLENDWAVKQIPNEDDLYMRVHRSYAPNGELIPGVFRDRGEGEKKGMSTDWSRLSTPQTTRERASNPRDNGVIGLNVGNVRSIDGLTVHHSPDKEVNNPSHTDVKGEKTTEVRAKLWDQADWLIYPDDEL